MALQFTIIEGSLKIVNTDSQAVILLFPKQDLAPIANSAQFQDNPKAVLYNVNLGYNSILFTQPLSNCLDPNGNIFTPETFLLFCELNLGFNRGGTAPKYKVFTALLTQSGGHNIQLINSGALTKGVTYSVENYGNYTGDFSNVGGLKGPSENPSIFVATDTAEPISWGEVTLSYNTGAPVVTILENTIGNIWFTYNGVGNYSINSNGVFAENKTWQSPINYTLPNNITEGYNFLINNANSMFLFVFQDGSPQDSSLLNFPIEIRVYN